MAARVRNTRYRREPLWRAAMIHRLSGLALALFLPLHFLALALALDGEARLDGALRWTDLAVFKLAETILVGLLAVHLLGGVRLLIVENLTWRPRQKEMAFAAIAAAVVIAAAFLARVV